MAGTEDQSRYATSTSSSLRSIITYEQYNNPISREAGPLPVKRGEIGYVEEIANEDAMAEVETAEDPSSSTEILAGPHPVEMERDGVAHSPGHPRRAPHERATNNVSSPLPPLPASSSASLPLTHNRGESQTSLTPSRSSSRTLLKHITPSLRSKSYLLGGTPRTVVRFVLQLLLLAATILGWVIAINNTHSNGNSNSTDSTNNTGNDPPPSNTAFGASGAIFIHVSFTVVTLIQLLFLERCIYLLRAERYMYKHPNSHGLPTHLSRPGFGLAHNRSMSGNAPRVAYAPWLRPPLPTYAAALGYRGTGDVEDSEVARVMAIGSGEVPPQYGNTRGSTLLAYGFGVPVNNRNSAGSLGSGRAASQVRMTQLSPASGPGRDRPFSAWIDVGAEANAAPERPVSYGRSEQLEEAFRAQKLEQALAKLEAGSENGHDR